MEHNFPEAPVAISVRNRNVTLEDFSYLWKTEDPEWMAQREQDWLSYVKPIFKDYPKREQKILEKYFKYGKKDKYYPASDWFFLTPYDSVDTIVRIMDSHMFDSHEQQQLGTNYLLKGHYRFAVCPWYRSHMELFIRAYFLDGYTLVKQGKRHTVSPNPTWWSNLYLGVIIDAIDSELAWVPTYQCLDYFISILPFALRTDLRDEMNLDHLLQLVDEKLSQGHITGELKLFVERVKEKEQQIRDAWAIGEQKIAAGIVVTRE